MLSFKNDYCFAYLGEQGQTTPSNDDKLAGFYLHDIRHLSQYDWQLDSGFRLIAQDVQLNEMKQHYSIVGHHREQARLHRHIIWDIDGFEDILTLHNFEEEEKTFQLTLNHRADFMDLFALRSAKTSLDFAHIDCQVNESNVIYKAILQDGSHVETCLSFSLSPSLDNIWHISLKPQERMEIKVKGQFKNHTNKLYQAPLTYQAWKEYCAPSQPENHYENRIYEAAVKDLYYLQLSTPFGFYPAAGTPLFVTPFGRDSLIVADFLAQKMPFLAKSVLSYAAHIQGKKYDAYHEEEPGKIFHEVRCGTLAKLGQIPFSQYYGTADATSLWLKLFGKYIDISQDISFAKEYKTHILTAFEWILKKMEKTGYIQFMPEGSGLSNQNWKDSAGSNCHENGQQAEAPIANIEVQAYAYAALDAAQNIFEHLQENILAQKAQQHKQALFSRIQKDFWLEDKGFYAMGLDANLKPLKVCNSNMGHILWCKAAPQDRAEKVMHRLMDTDMWSGWGLRTLSCTEKAYDPLGYHIGTVWPHDTAIFALGASYYGNRRILEKTRQAFTDLAYGRQDLRLPEVFGGFARSYSQQPIPYVNSCIPQAWAAAAFISLYT